MIDLKCCQYNISNRYLYLEKESWNDICLNLNLKRIVNCEYVLRPLCMYVQFCSFIVII